MDVFIKEPRSDNHFHVLYKDFESVPTIDEVKHDIVKEALRIHNVRKPLTISFKADTPAGTGLGSSGACAVAVHRGIATFLGKKMTNRQAAEHSFALTQRLGLPDGVQDPYVCAEGGFVTLNIAPSGKVVVSRPRVAQATIDKFFKNSIFYYTGVVRSSEPILRQQEGARIFDLKHKSKEMGFVILECFKKGNLNDFGKLLDEYWQLKKSMSAQISSALFDEIYEVARHAGALGGKIMGAGGGGYFMFYCPSQRVKKNVREVLERFAMKEMIFALDSKGARTKVVNF